jgi:dephospho-CoA kinase
VLNSSLNIKMLKIGLTGGIGSGKSVVSKVFLSLGIPIYQADQRAKLLIATLPQLREKITGVFGNEAFTANGYNVTHMAGIVFTDREKLQTLNTLVHPYVQSDFISWCEQHQDKPYAINEAAILFESNAAEFMDYSIVVDAPLSLRIQRVINRDRITPEQVQQRISNQYPADKIGSLADWVIVNDDKNLILPQIINIHNVLLRLTTSHG